MVTSNAQPGISLRIERLYAASPERVFDAWTNAEALSTWFAPSDEYTVSVDAPDVRVGGRYRIEMRHVEGGVHVVVGEYRELDPPNRLVMTWAWEGQEEMGRTLVTVELVPQGASTHLVLTHDQFPNEGARNEHQKGWTGCLARLGSIVGLAAQEEG